MAGAGRLRRVMEPATAEEAQQLAADPGPLSRVRVTRPAGPAAAAAHDTDHHLQQRHAALQHGNCNITRVACLTCGNGRQDAVRGRALRCCSAGILLAEQGLRGAARPEAGAAGILAQAGGPASGRARRPAPVGGAGAAGRQVRRLAPGWGRPLRLGVESRPGAVR
ncbi:hypothetical protein ACFV9E_18320 [Streptomyces sp. NPDC059835]|uniref:hypothetical protein n=1 Tax=Streptomyces sp. NPDC059835 TaxID=3346967 RepID=UPI00365D4BCA